MHLADQANVIWVIDCLEKGILQRFLIGSQGEFSPNKKLLKMGHRKKATICLPKPRYRSCFCLVARNIDFTVNILCQISFQLFPQKRAYPGLLLCPMIRAEGMVCSKADRSIVVIDAYTHLSTRLLRLLVVFKIAPSFGFLFCIIWSKELIIPIKTSSSRVFGGCSLSNFSV